MYILGGLLAVVYLISIAVFDITLLYIFFFWIAYIGIFTFLFYRPEKKVLKTRYEELMLTVNPPPEPKEKALKVFKQKRLSIYFFFAMLLMMIFAQMFFFSLFKVGATQEHVRKGLFFLIFVPAIPLMTFYAICVRDVTIAFDEKGIFLPHIIPFQIFWFDIEKIEYKPKKLRIILYIRNLDWYLKDINVLHRVMWWLLFDVGVDSAIPVSIVRYHDYKGGRVPNTNNQLTELVQKYWTQHHGGTVLTRSLDENGSCYF